MNYLSPLLFQGNRIKPMCGRYTIRRSLRDLLDDITLTFGPIDLPPRYNVAPSQLAPIVRMDAGDKPTANLVAWGLIPSWTKGKPKIKPINAKCETAATSAMFRQAMERRRCLVPADGFYEWKGAKPPKQPFFIHLKDDKPFAFAGLWERWKPDPDAEPIDTFTILTTTPNELTRQVHNRMPVILEKSDYARWLDRSKKAVDVTDLLKPFPHSRMEAYPVSSRVNTPKNDYPTLVEKIEPGRDGGQEELSV